MTDPFRPTLAPFAVIAYATALLALRAIWRHHR